MPIDDMVYIPKVSKSEFDILHHYMYTGDLSVTCNNFLEIYRATSILEMQDVRQECVQVLKGLDDVQIYFYLYVTSKKMGVPTNSMRACRLIAHRFEEAICTHEFLLLSVDFVVEILSAQSIGARSEIIVFLAALKWLNHSYLTRSRHEVRVMECVRFSSMTMDEVIACYHPPYLPQVLNNPGVVTVLFRATCYITAKFLGQESWFKKFGNPKRNLALENLPMELWHPKLKTKSDVDIIKPNWSESPSINIAPKQMPSTTISEKKIISPQVKCNSSQYITITEHKIRTTQGTSNVKKDLQDKSKTSSEKDNFRIPSELNLQKDNGPSDEESSLEVRSFNSDLSSVESNHRGSDFVIEIDAPTFPKDLDEIPVKEQTTAEMSDKKDPQTAENSTVLTEKKSRLQGGGNEDKAKHDSFISSENQSEIQKESLPKSIKANRKNKRPTESIKQQMSSRPQEKGKSIWSWFLKQSRSS